MKVYSLWHGSVLRTHAPRLTMAHILQVTAERYGVTVADLKGPARHQTVSNARQDAMYLCHLAGRSYSEIGRLLGRDHATIIHGVKRHIEREEKRSSPPIQIGEPMAAEVMVSREAVHCVPA